jgi:hypothetical protein
MTVRRQFQSLLAVAAVLATAAPAFAGKTPTVRSEGQRSHGTREDITVPFLTNGRSAFGAYFVAPRIIEQRNVDDARNPQTRTTYNLPFYGAVITFGGNSTGASLRIP